MIESRRGHADRLSALAGQLAEAHGTEARVLAVDLAETDGVESVLRETDDLEVGLLAVARGSAPPAASSTPRWPGSSPWST